MILTVSFNWFEDRISDEPVNITGVDKVHPKCFCINGSVVVGIRKPILYSFALDKPPGHKVHKEPGIKLFQKVNKSVLSHITFYIEEDEHRPLDFNGEMITCDFTCQLVELKFYNIKMN